jgi:hypothetical protein
MSHNILKRELSFNLLTLFLMVFFAYGPSMAWHIPETGQGLCYDNAAEIVCPDSGSVYYGQDGNYSINEPSYTKLDGDGNELPQGASSWAMIRDNVTGLMWEVKQAGDGQVDYTNPHDPDNHYSWYDDNSATNGGYSGPGGTEPTTKDFVAALNEARFGGFDDWRLPTVLELSSILNYSRNTPAVDEAFFPNMKPSGYWTSSAKSDDPQKAWRIDLASGIDESFSKANRYYSIAVRGVAASRILIVNSDGTVTDTSTGLVWAQLPATDASGNAKAMTWQEALAHCEASLLAGFPDWRLPTVKELLSIADYAMQGPVIDQSAFPNTPASLFWTSTTATPDTSAAWHLDFGAGGSAYWVGKGSALYVRAVRGGKSPQPDTGSLTVTIEPAEAQSSGARWRRLGSSQWQESGHTEEGLPIGQYLLEFSDAAGWVSPQDVGVTVYKDQTAQVTSTYTQIPYAAFYVSTDYPLCGDKSPCFQSIPQAMAEEGAAKEIRIMAGGYTDKITASKNESLLLRGGYDSAFSKVVSRSSVEQIIIQDGHIIIENMEIGPSSSVSQATQSEPSSGSATSSIHLGFGLAQERGSAQSFLALAMPGSPEEALLNSLGKDADGVFAGCSPGGRDFILHAVNYLYRSALGRQPEPWAQEMWGCYDNYLSSTLGLDAGQIIWGIGCQVFESHEYAQRGRGFYQSLYDVFEGLLGRVPSAYEKERWLSGDWTFRQVVFGLTSGSEFARILHEKSGASAESTHKSRIAGLFIGMLDRYPTIDELASVVPEGTQGEDLNERFEELISTIVSSSEFKALEPTERGKRLRLGLTLGGG